MQEPRDERRKKLDRAKRWKRRFEKWEMREKRDKRIIQDTHGGETLTSKFNLEIK